MRLVLLVALALLCEAAPSERLLRLVKPLPAAIEADSIQPPIFPTIDNTASPAQLPISLLQLRTRQAPATPAEAATTPATPATGEAAAATAQGEAPGKQTPGADCSELTACEACVGPQACLWDHDTGKCVEKLIANLGPQASVSCDPDPAVRANWGKTHPGPIDTTDANTNKGGPEEDAQDMGKPPQLPVPPKTVVVDADVVPEPTPTETACPNETPVPAVTTPATPAEPTPSEPTPAEPTPTEPTEPTPAEPTPAEPTPAEPTPAEPTPAEPAPAEPTPAEPTPAEPAGEQAALAQQIKEVHESLTKEIRSVRDELRAEIRAALPAAQIPTV